MTVFQLHQDSLQNIEMTRKLNLFHRNVHTHKVSAPSLFSFINQVKKKLYSSRFSPPDGLNIYNRTKTVLPVRLHKLRSRTSQR